MISVAERPGQGMFRLGGADHTRFITERANGMLARRHRGLRFTGMAAGTSSAMPLLAHGMVHVASMGRAATPLERAAFKRHVGAEPLEFRIAHTPAASADRLATSLAIYVHRSNPITRLTTRDVARMFSIGNVDGDLSRWGQAGIGGTWTGRRIRPIGTPESSGFGTWMQATQLGGRPYPAGYQTCDDSDAILDRLADEPDGIAFAALGREDHRVKQIALASDAAGPFLKGTRAELASGAYPYGRYLFFYIRKVPGQPLDPLARDYLRLLLSPEGQAMIASQPGGYIPLTASEIATELRRLDA